MKYKEVSEVIEQVKDIICEDINGKVFDWHVAVELEIEYASLRSYKTKNRPINEETKAESKIITFCFKRNINVYEFLVKTNSTEAF